MCSLLNYLELITIKGTQNDDSNDSSENTEEENSLDQTQQDTIDENFHQLVTNMEREFGDGYKQITLLSNGFRWTIKTGVENRDNGKNILIHYQDILNEFKHYDGDVKVINEISQARSIVLINNIQDFEFTDDAIEVFRHPLMLGTHPIKIVTSKGSFSVNQKEFDKYILPLYTPTHNGVKWAHR